MKQGASQSPYWSGRSVAGIQRQERHQIISHYIRDCPAVRAWVRRGCVRKSTVSKEQFGETSHWSVRHGGKGEWGQSHNNIMPVSCTCGISCNNRERHTLILIHSFIQSKKTNPFLSESLQNGFPFRSTGQLRNVERPKAVSEWWGNLMTCTPFVELFGELLVIWMKPWVFPDCIWRAERAATSQIGSFKKFTKLWILRHRQHLSINGLLELVL